MKKALSWIPRRGLPILLLVALLCLLVYSVYLRMNATAIGGSFGQGLGELTGLAIGSFEGMGKES